MATKKRRGVRKFSDEQLGSLAAWNGQAREGKSCGGEVLYTDVLGEGDGGRGRGGRGVEFVGEAGGVCAEKAGGG